MFIDRGVRSSIISTVSVTSGRIFSATEAKLTRFIGMNIFNNGLQFRIGEEDTFWEMVSAAINDPRDYNISGRETVQGPLLDKWFDNFTNNQCEKLINRADIYGLHFQGDGATIQDTPLLNILYGAVHLPMSV